MELFNTPPYIETDPLDRYIISGSKLKIDIAGLRRNQTAHIRKDGLSLDGTNVVHRFAAQMDSSSIVNSVMYPWGLSSIVNDYRYIFVNNEECLNIAFIRGAGGATTIFIQEFINGFAFSDTYSGSVDTEYRFIVEWDKTIGAFGRVTVEIYSDEYITLVDTIFVNLHSSETYTNFYPINNFNDGGAQAADGFCQNYDLGVEAAGTGRRRRMILRGV